MTTEQENKVRFTISDTQAVLDRFAAGISLDGCRLAIIPESRYKEAVDLIKYQYIPDEPLSNAFDFHWSEDYEQLLIDILQENLSIMMVADDDRMMGIRISGAIGINDPPIPVEFMTSPVVEMMHFLTHKYTTADFFAHFGVEEAMNFVLVTVHRDFRQRGVGGKLIQASISLGVELGFKVIRAKATSNYTQRIFEKEGFTVLRELPYDEYLFKGQPLRNKTGPHTRTQILGKTI